MATRGKKVEIYYTSQGTTTGIDASALVFDGKNLNIYTHNKTFKGTDTTYDVFGPSGSNASSGLVPAPSSTAGSSKFLREDATWADLNLVNPYVGPTNDLDASVGYINATPGVGQTNKFFRSDGTWVSITKSTVGLNNVDNTSDASKTVAAAGKATNLAAGAAGSIPYQSASNTTAFLSSGSNGQILAYDSTNNKPYWKDDNNTWKPANTSQEGYVPKSTANKILRSNNDGTLYWGDDTNTWRPVGTGATDAAAGNHTHGISIATDSGTNQISLAAGTKYKLTAGGQSYIFTTPSDSNTDTKVSQVDNNDNAARPILVKNGTGTGTVTDSALFADGVTVNPSNNSLSISGNLSVTGTASFSNNVTLSAGLSHSGTSGNFTWGHLTIYGSGSNGGINSMLIGDDVTIGDCNVGGIMGMKSTGANCGFRFFNSSGTNIGTLQSTAGTLQFNDQTIIHSGNISSQNVSYANSAGSVAWGNVTGKPSTYAPSSHTHDYVAKSGDTMSDTLIITGSSGWREGIRINTCSNGWTTLILGSSGTSGTNSNAWSFHTYGGTFYFANNGSSSYSNGISWTNGGALAITTSSSATLNGYSILTTNNLSGTSFRSGYSSAETHNCNDAWENGHYYYYSNGPSGLGESTSDGALYVQSYNSAWVGQIAQDYRNGRLWVRGKNGGSWTSWIRIANYNEIPSTISWSNVSDKMGSDNWRQPLCYINGYTSDLPRLCLHIPGSHWANISVDSNAYFHFRQTNSASGTYTNIYMGNAYASSDRHLKKNIQDIDRESLDELFEVCEKLFKKFTWKSSGKDSYGLIAQAIEKYIPEAVSESNDGSLSINYEVAYAKLLAMMIYKLKEKTNSKC